MVAHASCELWYAPCRDARLKRLSRVKQGRGYETDAAVSIQTTSQYRCPTRYIIKISYVPQKLIVSDLHDIQW